jgi:hypothetical protein
MIMRNIKINGNPSTLVRRIQELLQLNWHVLLSHTWLEGNSNPDGEIEENRSVDWPTNIFFALNSFQILVMDSS